jgi:hypothetical protein
MTKLHIMNIKLYNIHDTKNFQYWENETQIQTNISFPFNVLSVISNMHDNLNKPCMNGHDWCQM